MDVTELVETHHLNEAKVQVSRTSEHPLPFSLVCR